MNLGIILAGGSSNRLKPATLAVTKQLLSVYDKPMIYYPLSTLMLAGIRDIVLITTEAEQDAFKKVFEGSQEEFGVNITYAVQKHPGGIPEAYSIVADTLGNKIYEYEKSYLILGDNIFYGATMTGVLNKPYSNAIIFLQRVSDPQRFGVVELDMHNTIVSMEEKPNHPKSNLAVTGLYVYPNDVYEKVSLLKPSPRNELEMMDLSKMYLVENRLQAIKLARGIVWFDCGTADSLLEASQFIQVIQKHHRLLVGSPHEIAFNNKWISNQQFSAVVKKFTNSNYGNSLGEIV